MTGTNANRTRPHQENNELIKWPGNDRPLAGGAGTKIEGRQLQAPPLKIDLPG